METRKKILLVDDEQDNIDFGEAMLMDLGDFDVHSASNGFTGLELANQIKPDLIVLDVQMPAMNGFQVFKELKKNPRTERIPVIMLTGIASTMGMQYNAKDMEITLGHKPQAYIDKPVDPDTFKKTVAQLLSL
jgi:two-component system alkaline phosphatase synthesis response regulator PhoP